jgi:TrmH family RNA methyltransferase
VKAARRLQRRVHRTEEGLFLAEGAKALTEALLAPGGVVEVFATADAGEEYAALRKAVDDAGVPWTPVADDAVAALQARSVPAWVAGTIGGRTEGADSGARLVGSYR